MTLATAHGVALEETSAPTTGRTGPRSRRRRGLPLVLCMAGAATIGLRSRQLGGYPLSDWIFAASAGAIALISLSGRRAWLAPAYARRAPNAVLVATLVLLTAGAVSSLWAADPFESAIVVLRLAWVTLGWFWLFRTVSIDRAALADLILALRVTVMINCVAAIGDYLGVLTFVPPDGATYGNRQVAFYGHPNHLGSLLSVGCLLFLFDLGFKDKAERSRWATPMRFVCLGIVLFATSSTGSMTAAASVIAGGVVIFAILRTTNPRRKRARVEPLRNIALIVISALALAWFLQSDSSVLERFSLFRSGDAAIENSVESRGEFTSFVWNRVDRLLVVGVGMDAANVLDDEGRTVDGGNHNMPMKMLYQAGLPAVAALIAIMIIAFRMSWILVLSTRGTPLYPLAVTLIGALTALVVTAQSFPATYDREIWLPVALLGSLWALRKQELAAMSPGAPVRSAPAMPQGPAPSAPVARASDSAGSTPTAPA